MKNVFQIVQDVWDELMLSSVAAALTGSVYKHKLPVNIGGENLLVKCTALNSEQLQKAEIELHLYLPSIPFSTDGGEDPQPDDVRFAELEPMIEQALNGLTKTGFCIDTVSPGILQWNKDLSLFYLNKTLTYLHENF